MTRVKRVQANAARSGAPITPLTERILAIFPGPRWVWTVAWALLVIPQALLLIRIVDATGASPVVQFTPKLSYWWIASYVNATFLSVTGARLVAAELRRTAPVLARLTGGRETGAGQIIRGLDSVWGPVLLTLGIAMVGAVLVGLDYGWQAALVSAPILFLSQIPLLSFFWAYSALLLGLDRLGRRNLRLDPTPSDRSLGLRPVGRLAFTGFWIFSLGLAPILVVVASSTPTLVLNLVFFLVAFVLFVLSLRRLHGQMAAAKQEHIGRARKLYAEVYASLGPAPRLRTLRAQAALLGAAEALEKRGLSIQEWPFDEVLTGRIAIILTSVVAAVIARIILGSFGL